jgi:hypothetical protein
MRSETAEAIGKILASATQTGSEEIKVFDKDSGKNFRIRIDVESVPSYLKESFRDYQVKISAGGPGAPCPRCGGSGRFCESIFCRTHANHFIGKDEDSPQLALSGSARDGEYT